MSAFKPIVKRRYISELLVGKHASVSLNGLKEKVSNIQCISCY